MRTYYLYSAIAGFFTGVALALLGLPTFTAAALFLVIVSGGTVLIWRQGNPSYLLILIVIFMLAATAGLVRTGLDTGQDNEVVFDPVVDKSVSVSGVVTDVPAVTSSGQTFTVTISHVSSESGGVYEGKSRAVVYAGHFPKLNYGDAVELSGRLEKPDTFVTDSGRLFNYPRYLARQEVFYEMSRPTMTVTDTGEGSSIKGWLASLRNQLLAVIHSHVPDPHAALTGGVLLGAEDALGDKLQKAFRDTGLIHIVVLSGYNVTIVAVAIGAVLLFLGIPVAVASFVAGLGIAAFALLVGLTPTVVRASIMAIIALIGRVFSRQYAASRGLALAAFIMVAVNPHILLFDPSFQLSAVATAGLIGFGDTVSDWLTTIPETFGLREAATATISAQIAVLPLLAFYTGSVSIVSLLANLLVLPVVPLLMAAGVLTAVVGWLYGSLTLPFAGGSYLISEYIFTVTEKLADLSFATASVGTISVEGVFTLYILLILCVYTISHTELMTSVKKPGRF